MSVETMNIRLEFGANLLDDEAGQDVHDEASQPGIHGERLDDGTHKQHGEGTLLHQLLHHHRQNLRRVHVLLPKAQVGSCSTDTEHFKRQNLAVMVLQDQSLNVNVKEKNE